MLLNIPQAQGSPSTKGDQVQDVSSDEAEKSWLGGIRGERGKRSREEGMGVSSNQCLRLRAPGAVGSAEAAVAIQL